MLNFMSIVYMLAYESKIKIELNAELLVVNVYQTDMKVLINPIGKGRLIGNIKKLTVT